MTQTITTSIRLTPILRRQLEQTAHTLHRGKNWIIIHALEEYLAKSNQHILAKEARRQSLLASHHDDDEAWEQNTDTQGWI